ncbi:MAG: dihydrofolate reductase family protein [Alphaproteobacteria bacterium]
MKDKIILLVATTKDGFIADKFGNGDFSSAEDKCQFRAFLHSDKCDCFLCGRKTAEEFITRLSYKPLFVLTTQQRENTSNCFFIKNLSELYTKMQELNLTSCALLGGAQTYHYFLDNNAVCEIHQTEENLYFREGVSLNLGQYLNNFDKTNTRTLSSNTKVFTYMRKQYIRE